MSQHARLPDFVHEAARDEAAEKGESIGDIVFEWLVLARGPMAVEDAEDRERVVSDLRALADRLEADE